MNKKDLIRAISDRATVSAGQEVSQATVASVIDSFWEVVSEAASTSGHIKAWNMLDIKRVQTKERQGYNPKTREPITIPAGETVKVKPMARLKQTVLS